MGEISNPESAFRLDSETCFLYIDRSSIQSTTDETRETSQHSTGGHCSSMCDHVHDDYRLFFIERDEQRSAFATFDSTGGTTAEGMHLNLDAGVTG